GMTSEQQHRVFQPFAQADASMARRFGGTGLGLVISQQLVALMGGELSAHCVPGQGSDFHFDLKLRKADPKPLPAPVSSPLMPRQSAPTEWPGLKGRSVLLVEDNEFNQMVAGELLRDVAGMWVAIASNGEEALALLAQQSFDAVLMDIQMPGLDGYEATRQLRAQGGANSRVPVIAMTAHATQQDRQQCLAAGMNDYISKPVMPQELFTLLEKWIGARRAP
ncbi:MAG: response regulator, partial [Burkholderiales bacterium]|nr:response regulator [Burkholderiales bacterium]